MPCCSLLLSDGSQATDAHKLFIVANVDSKRNQGMKGLSDVYRILTILFLLYMGVPQLFEKPTEIWQAYCVRLKLCWPEMSLDMLLDM